MAPTLLFADNHSVAVAVRDFGEASTARPQRLTLLPYNYLNPAFSEWWLVPGLTATVPAYRHGKGFFRELKNEPGVGLAYIGFYVEKGFEQREAKVLGMPLVKVMDSKWCWHSVIASAKQGELDGPIATVSAASQIPVVLSVSAGEPNATKEGNSSWRPKDQVTFNTGPPSGTLIVEQKATGVLTFLNDCHTVKDLSTRIEQSDALPFYWIDFSIGVRLRYDGSAQSGWGAPEVWNRAIAPWIPWLK